MLIRDLALFITLAPLLGAAVAGLACRCLPKRFVHAFTISLVLLAFMATLWLADLVLLHGMKWHGTLFTWAVSGSYTFNIGFLIDSLSTIMMLVVTSVSLLVHIYSMGYMRDDAGYNRFFSYVSLFTFAMLSLVAADNFLLLFFGWEGVGLVSYLLIGFWFHKPTAAAGSLKAFLTNRVGDFGFILALAAILEYCGTLDYAAVFAKAPALVGAHIALFPGTSASVLTLIGILLFVGAMGKSAQVPLHIWLPESMEGPTPISALIHAATMVTAGVYLVARMSPLFALSPTALSVVLVFGATGALFLGLLAFVENDIKRVVAYSTMSQLGYMMAANGVAAYSASIFHLAMHAFFKSLLFLAAGSVIIAMHHEQDMRKMGGLAKRLPWTYATFLIGSLSLAALPPFSGFFSKDTIIEAVQLSQLPGATYAYWALVIGGFVTSFYTFRALFMTFHGQPRWQGGDHTPHETPWSMRLPLVILAVFSVVLGGLTIHHFLYAQGGFLQGAIVMPKAGVMSQLAEEFHGVVAMMLSAPAHLVFWLALAGLILAAIQVLFVPKMADFFAHRLPWVRIMLQKGYGIDIFNERVILRSYRCLSQFFYEVTDLKMVDGAMVHGTANRIVKLATMIKGLQSGYLYHYVLSMLIGVVLFTLSLIII